MKPTEAMAAAAFGTLKAVSPEERASRMAAFDPSTIKTPAGVEIDPGFAPAAVPASKSAPLRGDRMEGEVLARAAMAPEASEFNYIVRAQVDEKQIDKIAQSAGVVGVFSDPAIQPCLICPGSPALGDDTDVEKLLCVPRLRECGLDGAGVLVAIVDTGVNMAHLNSKGKHPSFDRARSWVPPSAQTPGQPPLVPGELAVGHGTMCAYDVCIAAPRCTLLDIALLLSNEPGSTVMEGFLSDAVKAYEHLLMVMTAPKRPGEGRSLVINNSWGMFHPSWDFPAGHPGNYSDNPNHPFNRIVTTLERAGADILFAAGNCGADCPDGRCQNVTSNAIYGANSHPGVLSVAGVDTSKQRVGYSSIGPGRLTNQKPDISGYTHFKGSDVYAADGGTSAACPVVAGVVAAIRTRRPFDPTSAQSRPAAIRGLVTSTAEDLGGTGYDFEYGHGVVNGCAIAERFPRIKPDPVSERPDLCRIFPGLCRNPIWERFCRRYPWLCQIIGQRLPIPGLGGGGGGLPSDIGMSLPGPDNTGKLGGEEADPVMVAYLTGYMHGRGAAADQGSKEHGGGCGCKGKS